MDRKHSSCEASARAYCVLSGVVLLLAIACGDSGAAPPNSVSYVTPAPPALTGTEQHASPASPGAAGVPDPAQPPAEHAAPPPAAPTAPAVPPPPTAAPASANTSPASAPAAPPAAPPTAATAAAAGSAAPALPAFDAGSAMIQPDGKTVIYHIPDGTGGKDWNPADKPIKVRRGMTLRLIDDDKSTRSGGHWLHTNGQPCPHGLKAIGTGFDCVIGKNAPMGVVSGTFEHNVANGIGRIYIEVVPEAATTTAN